MKTRIAALCLIALLPACAEVKVWQRNTLARPDMQFDTGGHRGKMERHVYFSKEASDGGSSVGGGGCGCN